MLERKLSRRNGGRRPREGEIIFSVSGEIEGEKMSVLTIPEEMEVEKNMRVTRNRSQNL